MTLVPNRRGRSTVGAHARSTVGAFTANVLAVADPSVILSHDRQGNAVLPDSTPVVSDNYVVKAYVGTSGTTYTEIPVESLYWPRVIEWFMRTALKGFERAVDESDALELGFIGAFTSADLNDTWASHPGWDVWSFRASGDEVLTDGGTYGLHGFPYPADDNAQLYAHEDFRRWYTTRATLSDPFDTPTDSINGMYWRNGNDLLAVHRFTTPFTFSGLVNPISGSPLEGYLREQLYTTAPCSFLNLIVNPPSA